MSKPDARVRLRAAPAREFDEVVKDVQTRYGAHVMHVASHKPLLKHIPMGVFTADMALFGGVPEGLITLMYGREGSGKSTLATRCVAGAQRKYPDRKAVFMDIEGTYDAGWAAQHGVDNDNLFLVQPQSGEQALDIAIAVMSAGETSIVVVDSLAALIPVRERDASIEDEFIGIGARMISKFCRKTQNTLLDERKRDHKPALLLLNQWRTKIGGFSKDNRVLPGGTAQHFLASVKMETLNREFMGKDSRDLETVSHNEHSFKIAKNKMGSGIRHGEFVMIRDTSNPLGAGFVDDARTVATWAKKMGVVTGGGNSWRVDGLDEKFKNLQAICDYFYDNMDFYELLKRRLITMQREACNLVPEGWY